jgi:transposase-like protein
MTQCPYCGSTFVKQIGINFVQAWLGIEAYDYYCNTCYREFTYSHRRRQYYIDGKWIDEEKALKEAKA